MQHKFIVNLAISCALSVVSFAQSPASGVPPSPAPARTPQQVPGTSPSNDAAVAHPESVGQDQAVITLKGGCQPIGTISPAKDCVDSVTRAQFEKLVNALQPEMTAEAKRGLALNYGKLLVFYDAALSLHLENDPGVQQVLAFLTKQALADGVRKHYIAQFAHVSDEQIQAYYKQNSAKFLEASLERVIMPRKPAEQDKPEAASSDEATAQKLRQRWAAGEDPTKLQQEAYDAIGVTGAGSPEVKLGSRRPGSLPVNQESVFELKAGEVSQVYADPAAYYIYKVDTVREIPLSEVKDGIIKALQQQQLQDTLEEISRSATPELNEQYFGPSPSPRSVGASPGAPAATPTTPPKQ